MIRRSNWRPRLASPCLLYVEPLEERRVPSAVHAALPPGLAVAEAAADRGDHGNGVGHAYGTFKGDSGGDNQSKGNGIGFLVRDWTHEGIHGPGLAERIHELHDKDGPGGPPPDNDGGGP